MKSQIVLPLLFLLFGGLLLGGCNHPTGLEGTWEGFEVRKPLINWTLIIHGNRFYLVREDLTMWYIGQFRLNNNCLRKKIDLQFSHSHIKAHKKATSLGIYELNENTLTFITAGPGENFRPHSFDEPRQAIIFSFVRS